MFGAGTIFSGIMRASGTVIPPMLIAMGCAAVGIDEARGDMARRYQVMRDGQAVGMVNMGAVIRALVPPQRMGGD